MKQNNAVQSCTNLLLLLTSAALMAEMMLYRNKRPLLWFLALPKPEPADRNLPLNAAHKSLCTAIKVVWHSNIPIVYTKNANNPEAITPILPMGGIWPDPCNMTGKVCHKALIKLKIPCDEQKFGLSLSMQQQQCWNQAAVTMNRSCLPEQKPYCEVAFCPLQPACTLQQLHLRLCFTEKNSHDALR